MRVVVKEPHKNGEVRELEDICAINQFVGNVDENGKGYDHGGTDIRNEIAKGIDMYVKEDAAYHPDLEGNLWSFNDMYLLCGNIVFAGYDPNVKSGACSLTDEQIETVMQFIERQKA